MQSFLAPSRTTTSGSRLREWLLGASPSAALGVLSFSLSLPATRAAVPELGGVTVGLGRAVVAAVLALLLLRIRREPLPERRHWASLAQVALGVVIGFPLLSATALRYLPSAHGAVLTGLLPAATALVAVARGHEHPPRTFWIGVGAGVVSVLLFALSAGAGHLQPGDALLLIAVAFGALGYTEGGRISRELGGWRTICWSLIIGLPVTLPLTVGSIWLQGGLSATLSGKAIAGFAYVSVISMFLGFFPWYRGMALGGVARTSQIQLLQLPLTLLWSGLLLGEPVRPQTILAAVAVLACVIVVQRTRRA